MTQEHNRDISQLYRQGATEQPDTSLDELILARAKQVSEQHNPPKPKIRSWRNWHWPFSVAASALLVSLLYLGNLSEYHPISHDEQNFELDENQTDFDVVVMKPSAQPLSERLETKKQGSDLAIYPEAEQLLSDSAKVDYQTTDQVQAVSAQRPGENLAPQLAESELVAVEARRRIALKVIDEPFLDTLLDEIRSIEVRLNEESLTDNEKRELNKQRVELNQAIFDELSLVKGVHPELAIPDKYLAQLNDEQKTQLNVNQVTPDEP